MSTSLRNKSRNTRQEVQPQRAAAKPASKSAPKNKPSWLRQLSSEWTAELRRCLNDPGVEEVHKVRTGTRRLEAQLETFLEMEKPRKGTFTKPAAAWMKQMKKIRRAAGSVRDLDVHRKLMEEFTGVGKKGRKLHEEGKQSEIERSTPTPGGVTTIEEQAEILDRWLQKRRDRQSAKLLKQIEKRLPKIEKVSGDFLDAYASYQPKSGSHAAPEQMALHAFARLSEEMPQLNALNLHDFRKRAKKARYLTESENPTPRAEKIGKTIKKIQDVIGDWHDWLALSEEAQVALEDNKTDLVIRLQEQVAAVYEKALHTTEDLRPKLLHWPPVASAKKKEVAEKKTTKKAVATGKR